MITPIPPRDPLDLSLLCPNCFNKTLFLSGYQINLRTLEQITWTGRCAKCLATVNVSGAKYSVIFDKISYAETLKVNQKLQEENAKLKDQLAKIKGLF